MMSFQLLFQLRRISSLLALQTLNKDTNDVPESQPCFVCAEGSKEEEAVGASLSQPWPDSDGRKEPGDPMSNHQAQQGWRPVEGKVVANGYLPRQRPFCCSPANEARSTAQQMWRLLQKPWHTRRRLRR